MPFVSLNAGESFASAKSGPSAFRAQSATPDPRTGHTASVEEVRPSEKEGVTVNILFIIVAVVAIILLFTGGFVSSLNFLLWIGLILLILAVIAFLIRLISGRRV
jgi:hypothetical protein